MAKSMEFSDCRVTLDADRKELMPGFLAFIEREIKVLHAALEGNDYETVSIVANRMRRFSGGYGYRKFRFDH